MAKICLQVCIHCSEAAGGGTSAGRQLFEALVAATADDPAVAIAPADCLAVCDRPVTLAFQAVGKWSYIIGGTDAGDVTDILAAAKAVARSPHGIPPMDDRPPFFRNGVIARVPPLPAEAD